MVAVTIRLKRAGSRHKAFYKVVVVDRRSPRDGSSVDSLGHYDPLKKPETIEIDEAKLNQWLSKGARASVSVEALLRRMKKSRELGAGLSVTTAAASASSAAIASGAAKRASAEESAPQQSEGAESPGAEGVGEESDREKGQ